MTFFVDSMIHVSMILLLALFSMGLLRKSSAAMRHWVLSAAIFCGAMVPALQFVVPSWSLVPVFLKLAPDIQVDVARQTNVLAIDFNRSTLPADAVAVSTKPSTSRSFPNPDGIA